ncbi:hypothetical protein LAZ67_7001363 [Cordylochernes scorpioides]|uniref:DUF5641 domain-containing protein n=1 Tax=Cordylochernes scorpioides TaxID=51811 RepID=A0ABY6KS91_9ARAC|nr:hypothetical protein LAZ67_7001363 [Cordylochernes scorpioides]
MFKLLDSCNEIVRTVKVLGYQIDSLSEVFFVKIIQDKLDKTTRKQWKLQNNPRVVPSIKDLMEFLEIHAKSLQNLPNKDSNVEKHSMKKELQKVNALVLDKLTNNLPTLTCPKSNLAHLKTMPLADPDYNISAPIDILIGAELAMTMFTGESVIGDEEQLTATSSKLGWFLSGRVSSKGSRRSIRNIIQSHHACLETQNTVEIFWKLESIPDVTSISKDENESEIHFVETHGRDSTGRYVVQLTFRNDCQLGDSRTNAIKRLCSLERSPNCEAQNSTGFVSHHSEIRIHPVAINADIAKMYRQIRISPEDSEFQRIVWRNDPHDKIKDYRLETVTYGTSCAPFLATRIIKQLALDEQSNFPNASKIALTDFIGALSKCSRHKGKNLVQELYGLLNAGGFELRKWTSNVPDVLLLLPFHLRSTNTNIGIKESKEFVNVLGLQWQPRTDGFTFKGIALPLNSMTKRGILSQVAKIFDSLGWISPFTTTIELNLQELWKTGLEWDDPIPEELRRKLTLINQDLPSLEHIQIPRCVVPGNFMKVEFHGFCDASKRAYAASLYLKTFVANRVAEIHRLVSGVWCHVDGRQNPADCASRGIFPSDLVEHPLWLNGPPWLIEPALEIKKFINRSKEEFKEEEKIKTYFGTIECEIPSIVINCSSLTKQKCIIAWCLRFVNNSRMPSHSRNREPLTLREFNDALLTVVKKTMGSALLNFEELTTLLAQIEACLNSRPLCPLSEDPEDLQALNPGHFLIGGSLTALPDEDDIIAMSLPNRWQLIQKSMNHFWTRWSQEYVSQLQQRSKWCKPKPNIKEGSLVLIKNEQQPPLAWKIGRISKVFPGNDARIRVVEVKTANGTYRRPIVLLTHRILSTKTVLRYPVDLNYGVSPCRLSLYCVDREEQSVWGVFQYLSAPCKTFKSPHRVQVVVVEAEWNAWECPHKNEDTVAVGKFREQIKVELGTKDGDKRVLTGLHGG